MPALVAFVALTLVGASGCQSNPEPPPISGDETSSSPSSSPSPSPAAPPSMPAEAKGTSEASAKAFVRHYVDLVNFAMRTGDTKDLETLASARCSTCDAITRRVEEVYDGGGRLEGDGWSIQSLTYLPLPRPGLTLVAAGIRIAPQLAYLGPTASPSQSVQSRGNLDFTLKPSSGSWVVVKLEATQ